MKPRKKLGRRPKREDKMMTSTYSEIALSDLGKGGDADDIPLEQMLLEEIKSMVAQVEDPRTNGKAVVTCKIAIVRDDELGEVRLVPSVTSKKPVMSVRPTPVHLAGTGELFASAHKQQALGGTSRDEAEEVE